MEIVDARIRLPQKWRPHMDQAPEAIRTGYGNALGFEWEADGDERDFRLDLQTAEIGRAVVHAEFEYGIYADQLNSGIAEFLDTEAVIVAGFGTADLGRPFRKQLLRQVDQVHSMDLHGLNLQPSFFGMAINDKHLFPIYERAEELGLVVAVHTGINYSKSHPISNERPILIDEVACMFPQLRIIACHGGWPWVGEMVAIMLKHENVYVDLGGLSPKYISVPGSGWEILDRFLRKGLIAKQVLYASDWPVFSPARAVEEWKALNIEGRILERVMAKNLLELLGIEQG